MVATLDPLGQPLTLADAGSAAAMAGFVEGLLGYSPRILEVLKAADQDDSPLVQTWAAVLWMFSESPAGPPRARAHLARADAAALPASPRERLWQAAVAAWVDGDLATALARHAQLVAEHPRDLAAAKLGQYHAFNLGDSPTLLKLALATLPAAADLAWAHGLVAFGQEQCHWLREAEASARRALAMQPAEAWAQHALAHVMLTEGRFAEGADFLASVAGPWRALTSFMRGHNAWHLALFQIELGDHRAALAQYDHEVWGLDTTYSQDQVGAVSLLARLELAGVDVGGRWDALAPHLAGRTHDQVQPFLDLQYLYGLARAGRPEADTLLAAMTDFAPRAPLAARAAWQQVALPAARGLLAHGRGRWRGDGPPAFETAARELEAALPRLATIGGSHAQRDLFEQIYLDALMRAGQWGGAQNLLRPRAAAAPASVRLRRLAGRTEAALGLPVRAA